MGDAVRLTVVPDEGAAEVVCGMLRAEGIACAHRRSDVGAGAADGSSTFGGWREILVDHDDVQRASELIAAQDTDEPSFD